MATAQPRFRAQVESLIRKDGRAKALNNALSPDDRIAFNTYLAAVLAVLLVPRFSGGAEIAALASFSEEVAASHRRQSRPINVFVIDEILRSIYGQPSIFPPGTVSPSAVSGSGAAVLRHLNNSDPAIAVNVTGHLDAADDLYARITA